MIIKEYALGDHSGNETMILPADRSVKLHGLCHVKHASINTLNEGREFVIEMKRLDDLEDLKECNVKGIKIDVENFEYFVLTGATELISRCKPIIYCELWDNENRLKTFNLLERIGYKVLVREEKKLIPYIKGKHKTQNFFFIPEKKNDSLNLM